MEDVFVGTDDCAERGFVFLLFNRLAERTLHILLDLDGTLVDTDKETFNDIKHGRDRRFSLSAIPSVPGAEAFVNALRERGHSVTIVSDSHDAYVGPVAEKRFQVPWLALSDKPNTAKLRAHLKRVFGFPGQVAPEEFLFLGDTKLDVQLARGLSIPSVMLSLSLGDHFGDPHIDGNFERLRRYQEGATYNCRSFDEALGIVDAPAKHRLVLEDPQGTATARLYSDRNANNGVTLFRGLGRQQQGPSDAYGAIGRYYKFGSADRTQEFLQEIAGDVNRYLRTEVLSHRRFRWDMITCVADKATTQPPRKMAEFLHALDIGLPKEELFDWAPDITGSIRQEKKRVDRTKFIDRFLILRKNSDLKGKNVIVVDDQYTTGATAMSHAKMLLDAGVCNVLFLALFYITNEVQIEKICPNCKKIARIKYRKRDGKPFFNCVPPQFNGDGCGWMGDIDSAAS